jgi:hypothetical protein
VQLGPTATGHDLKLGTVDPRDPIGLGLAVVPVERMLGLVECALYLARVACHGM